ncbi:hypothetical protein Tco_0585968 [Tanacetum coccineum]
MILAAQAFKQENILAEWLHSLDQQMERKGDESLYFMNRVWVILVGSVMDEAYASRYLVHPGADKMYYNLGDMYCKEWNSGDDQHKLRWMIYLVVLADAVQSVRDAIGFEYFLASSSGWTKSPVLWAEIGESSLTGLELVQETTDKVVLVKEKPKAVTPWKGIVRFGKKGKLALRYIGPFKILERIGLIAYRLSLPEELNSVHVHLSCVKSEEVSSGC